MTWFSFMSLFCTVCGVFCHPDRAEWTCHGGGGSSVGALPFLALSKYEAMCREEGAMQTGSC